MSDNVKALRNYKKELEKIRAKYVKKLDKELEKHNKRIKQFKEDYPDTNAIDEAYGIGLITRSKRDKLYEIFDNFELIKNYNSVTGLMLKMLDKDINEIETELRLDT